MGIYIGKSHPRLMLKSGLRLNELPNEQNWSEELVKVSLSWNKISKIQPGISPMTPNLTTLMLNHNPLKEIPESFFVHMKSLTLLDLSCTDIEKLPESVSDLENLKSLLLCGCKRLVYIPTVAKLTQLRVLDLSDDMMIVAPKGLERLTFLEKLPHFIWRMSDVTSFNAITQLWQSALLCRFQFCLYDEAYADELPDIMKCHEKYQIAVHMIGGHLGEEEDPNPLFPCTTDLVGVFGANIEGKKTLTDALPSLAGLTELKVLCVVECAGLEYVMTSSIKQENASIDSQLETLEELELSWLPDLRGIINFGCYSFSQLKELRIKSCPKIKLVFSQNMAFHLPNLELIDVTDCNEVEKIFESNCSTSPWSRQKLANHDINDHTIRCVHPILCLPKLSVFSLENLPMLHSIYSGLLLYPLLRDVCTLQCAKLKLVSLSRSRIYDASTSTLASFGISDCLSGGPCIRTADKLYANSDCFLDQITLSL